MEEKIHDILTELRKRENEVPVMFVISSLFAIGLIFSISLYLENQSFYYLFCYVPYLLIGGVVALFGLPYPFYMNYDSFTLILNEDLVEAYGHLSNFSVGCLIIAPFAMITILFVLVESTLLVLFFQLFSHTLMISSFTLFAIVYFKPIPVEF